MQSSDQPQSPLAPARPSRLLYSQMREDPEIDVEALDIGPTDRVLTVTSAGDTTLTLLAQGPAEVVSVDFNPAQTWLVELKLAAIRHLDLEACRAFLGVTPSEDRWPIFQGLAAHLSPQARAYWEARSADIEGGVLYAGSTEGWCKVWMPRLVFWLIHPYRHYERLLELRSLQDQRDFYASTWNKRSWRLALRLAFHPWMFRLTYGPGFRERFGEGDITGAFIHKIERAFTELPVQDNYFLTQLLNGAYPPGEEGLPSYLRQPAYDRIRENADRLTLQTESLVDHLAEASPGRYTRVSLSNAFEWLPQPVIRPAFASLARAVVPEGRVVLRHLLAVTALPTGVDLQEDVPTSEDFTLRERAFLYDRVSLYRRLPEAAT